MLDRWNVTFKDVPFVPLDFDTEWGELSHLCGSTTSTIEAWKHLNVATGKSYSTVSEFEQDLFQALQEALGSDCCRKLELNERQKIIKFNNQSNWGFSTQVTFQDEAEEEPTLSIISSTISSARYDHACVLFDESEIDETEVTISGVMAVAELQMSDTSCNSIKSTFIGGERWNSQVPDLIKGHSPIAQNLVYVLLRVIPDHVRNNVQPEEIPILVLAGKRKKRKLNDDKLSFVRGNVHIPTGFGDDFQYSVSSFGDFSDYKQGIAAYINTLSFGVKAVIYACERQPQLEPLAMLCSSRHKLFEWTIDNCKLIASPIPGDRRFGAAENGPQIYQGELFHAILLRKFFDNVMATAILISDEVVNSDEVVLLGIFISDVHKQSDPIQDGKIGVVIKVSSVAVHNTLVEPVYAEKAFLHL